MATRQRIDSLYKPNYKKTLTNFKGCCSVFGHFSSRATCVDFKCSLTFAWLWKMLAECALCVCVCVFFFCIMRRKTTVEGALFALWLRDTTR
uniref:Uncharacterized protein n=1 Tax=Rhipicephalus zambeziensis TaxID=60191 RepID=A0A224Y8R6_9ACAR